MSCPRCGYSYHTTAVVDRPKSKAQTEKLKRLYKQGKIDEAYAMLNYEISPSDTRELKENLIKDRLKRGGFKYIKLNKAGKWIHRSFHNGGWGAFHYMPTDKSVNDKGERLIVGGGGSIPKGKAKQAKHLQWLRILKNKYHCKVTMTALVDGKIKKVRV